jgi:hypothetical protein
LAENSYPFGVTAGTAGDLNTEDQWTKMARLFSATGVAGDPGSTEVQAFADATGMVVKVRTGRAIVRGVFYENTATKSLTIAANSTGSTRIDRIVLKLDPVANTVTAVVKTGSTSAPALTQDDLGVWEMPLARVTVANGAVSISLVNVTDERVHTDADVIPCRTVADLTGQRFGSTAAEFTTGLLKWWNGTAWLTIPNLNDLPRLLGYKELASTTTMTLSGGTIDIPGLSTTVAVNAGQRIRLTADISAATGTNANLILSVREGTTALQSRWYSTSLNTSMRASTVLSPTAGTHTYVASLATTVPGMSVNVVGQPGTTSFIEAEYLGAAS